MKTMVEKIERFVWLFHACQFKWHYA